MSAGNLPDEHLITAHAAVCIPMAWLTQKVFPSRTAVREAFRQAVSFLAGSQDPETVTVRQGLESIVAGTDPRGGTFSRQALSAAARLHDINARNAVRALDAAAAHTRS